MIQKINESVSVQLIFKSKTKIAYPACFIWRERLYKVKKVGLHHVYRVGKLLFHIFSVTDGNLFFRLSLNSESLHWLLEEIADGEAD